jgi:hypothetical protein
MRWVPDSTGRFGVRPQYSGAELDAECERNLHRFLAARYGRVNLPVSTDALTIMLEQATSDFDLYADLRSLGADVEGVTEFSSDRRPCVRISKELSLDCHSQRRLRTTLAHEYAHVKLHSFLWNLRFDRTEGQFWSRLSRQHNRYQQLRARLEQLREATGPSLAMSRSGMLIDLMHSESEGVCEAPDWMEMQAAYASRSLLMPFAAFMNRWREINPDRSGAAGECPITSKETETILADSFDVPIAAVHKRVTGLREATDCLLL